MLMPSLIRRNDLFDDFFNDFDKHFELMNGFHDMDLHHELMKTDIKETKNGYELTIDLPGVNKEDVKAELNDGYLTVSYEHNEENNEKGEDGKFLRRERFFGSAKRSYYVGEEITEEDIKAKFDKGTLKLELPKKEPKQEIPEKHFISID